MVTTFHRAGVVKSSPRCREGSGAAGFTDVYHPASQGDFLCPAGFLCVANSLFNSEFHYCDKKAEHHCFEAVTMYLTVLLTSELHTFVDLFSRHPTVTRWSKIPLYTTHIFNIDARAGNYCQSRIHPEIATKMIMKMKRQFWYVGRSRIVRLGWGWMN